MHKFSKPEVKHLFQKCLHPDPKFQLSWLSLQWAVALMCINALLAAIPLAFTLLSVLLQYWKKIASDRIGKGFLYFCGCLLITCLWSIDPLNSLLGLFNYIPFILFFLGLRLVLRTTEQLRRLAWIIVTGSIFNATIGLGQYFLNWSKQINFSLPDRAFKASETIERMSATFDHANFFAGYLVIALILGTVLWCEIWQQKPWQHWQRKQTFSIAILSASIFLNLICIFYTSSRNGWLTLLLAASALMLFYGQRLIVIALGAIAATVMGAAFAGEPIQSWLRQIVPYAIWARINGQMYAEPYANSRVAIWEYAWNLTQQRPWTGWGLQTFSQLYKSHAQIYLGHAHNLFLTLSSSIGIPVTLMLIILVGLVMFRAVKNLSQAPVGDRQILFGFILAFSAFISLNTVDVTIFEMRLNVIAWLSLAAICVNTTRTTH